MSWVKKVKMHKYYIYTKCNAGTIIYKTTQTHTRRSHLLSQWKFVFSCNLLKGNT